MTTSIKKMLTAADAAHLLDVSPATLYSYVSRGLLASQPGPAARGKLYAHDEVLRLAARRKDGRQAGHAVEQAIDWGKPILESAITLIDDGVIRYRGRDAIKLAAGATLEQVAAILWGDPDGDFFAHRQPALAPQLWRALRQPYADYTPLERAAALLPAAAPHLRAGAGAAGPGPLAAGAPLMRVLAAALLGGELSAQPLHQQMCAAWRLDATAAALIRAALVVCADHELNVSTFAVRCVASSGAQLDAALSAGLAALSGPMHGGELARVRACLDAALADIDADVKPALRRQMRAQQTLPGFSKNLPGFGHPLYPGGDPRGALLLKLLAQQTTLPPARHAEAARIAGVAAAAEHVSGERPNVDFGLVAIERVFGLPAGAALAIFALGRAAGWIAHAAEQVATGRLIRPRARYVGDFDFQD